ncbi:MAG: PAS domain S-box protein [Desulfobacter sp.]|nr:MAG: PAS domain S-box protein [Desulfobacter sp.]
MDLSEKIRDITGEFMAEIHRETGLPVLIYDAGGMIVQAVDQSRIGNIHPGAEKIMKGLSQEYAVTPEEAAGDPLVLEGYNCPIYYEDKIVGGFGITGPLAVAKPLARVAARMIDLWLADVNLQEALRQSEKKYRTLFDSSTDAIFIIDQVTNCFVDCNRAAAGLFGIAEIEKIIGQTPYHFSPEFQPGGEPSRELVKKYNDRVYEEGSCEFEWTHAGPDGHPFPVHVTLSPMRLDDRKFIIAFAKNISARKQAEKERENLIESLRDAFENISTLSGLLPICANCKKIRDDKGYWNRIESYIQEHSDARFSHGLCPECTRKMYGDKPWYKKMKQKEKGKSQSLPADNKSTGVWDREEDGKNTP